MRADQLLIVLRDSEMKRPVAIWPTLSRVGRVRMGTQVGGVSGRGRVGMEVRVKIIARVMDEDEGDDEGD